MQPIFGYIATDDTEAILNLQEGLRALMPPRRDVIAPQQSPDRGELEKWSKMVMLENGLYGAYTSKVVALFQQQQGLDRSRRGSVDPATADALNRMLREVGELPADPGPNPDPDPDPDASVIWLVSGVVQREDDALIRAASVRAYDESSGASVRLGSDTTDSAGRYTIRYEPISAAQGFRLRVSAFDDEDLLLSTVVLERPARIAFALIVVPFDPATVVPRRIEGQVITALGAPAENLALRLYRLDFGGQRTLVSETVTLRAGHYALSYPAAPRQPSFQIHVVKGNRIEVALTKPLDDLGDAAVTTLKLVLPAELQPQAAEFRRMVDAVTPHVGNFPALANAREDLEQRDITVLCRATGWDARLIALAATAERFAADAEIGLPSQALYGLLRAGLPSDKLLLAQVPADVVDMALKKVRDSGIADVGDDAAIAVIKGQFNTFANRVKLAMPTPGSKSTYGELLQSSGIAATAQDKFAPIFLQHRGTGAQLWQAAATAGLDGPQIGRLQLQGKLSFLAGNSGAMTSRILGKNLANPADLVEQGFHDAAAWKSEVFAEAGVPPARQNNLTDADRARLAAVIPAAYADDRVEARLDAYSADMARKLRLSYPTQVIGRLMETDQKFRLPADHDDTTRLVKRAAARGFRFGETPVATFLKANADVQADLDDDEFEAAGQQIKMLQRVYQITPSNEAMPVLIDLQMTSAFDVTAYSIEQFVPFFEKRYFDFYNVPAPEGMARLVYRKAKQVSSVTYNLFTIAKKLDSEPPIAGMSAPVEVRESVKNELLKHYPTMESLFGSMDYCECDHCRSVLSPAAYFVDLLQFVDTEPGVWGNYLAQWRNEHGGQNYPHKDANGVAMKPYDVLVERRPDLPHIALTCENTHTALPYIDIVNEILEYHVAHGVLEKQAARDTGDASTPELLAEPQNVIREAYDVLRDEAYPLDLPFDLWIETVRRFCDHFETPLHQVLEVFRQGDGLFVPAQTFDRAAVFMESLGLSPKESAIFTRADPLANWFELYGFASDAQARTVATDATSGQRIDLNSAKALSRRLAVNYAEITEIVQTGFVNPALGQLALLYKLGVSVADARSYRANKALLDTPPASPTPDQQKRQLEAAAFRAGLQALATRFGVTLASLEAEITAIPLGRVLILADPDAGCNFDLTTLQYADGTAADAIVLLRINLFVRLWRKLGWSIEEIDRALACFVPSSAPFDGAPVNMAKQPLKTALIYTAHLSALAGRLKLGKQGRMNLLALWSDIATTGKKPLYARLFLTRSVLKTAPVFDHPLGQYLSDATVPLQDHLLALQGALALSADDISRILTDADKSIATAKLTLPNVSQLFRCGMLAKTLKLSVRELLALKQLSGVNPFKPVQATPLTALDEDHPFAQTLEFVTLAEEVKASGLTVDDLDYLLRHRFDQTSKYRPDSEASLAALKAVAEGVRAIRAEHVLPIDPAALSDEVLRQKLGLLLPADVVTTFLSMMSGTVEFSINLVVATASQLQPADFAGEPTIRVSPYDAITGRQALLHRGVLFDPQRAALKAAFAAKLPAAQRSTFEALLDALQLESQQQAQSFFDAYLLRQQELVLPSSGFLLAADFELLFSAPAAGLSEAQRLARERARRTRLVLSFWPFLQHRLTRQFVVQTMTSRTNADPTLLESLLTDVRLMAAPGVLLNALTAPADGGVTATFWPTDDASGAASPAFVVVDAHTAAQDGTGQSPKPAGSRSTRLEGYLEVPTTGAYRFYVELDKAGMRAELHFPHLAQPLFLQGTAAADGDTLGGPPKAYLELAAGTLYRYALDLKVLAGGDARLLVQAQALPKGPLARLQLYAAGSVDAAERAGALLGKALQLAQTLGLSERELRYLLTHSADFDNLSVSELPTLQVGDTPTERSATALRFKRWRRLASYARLQRELAGGTSDLIGIFEADASQVYSRIAQVTRRDAASVEAAARALVKAPAVPTFESERPLWRLWAALQVIERFGVPAASLQQWTRIVDPAATGQQRFETARDLKEAIKARFDPEGWQRVAQPIFDKLRRRQRGALVAHVMQKLKLDRIEQLYEYFLIDPGMEPVVQTSRIRIASASLQLFIQRALLNLEPKVHPSTINARQWDWMKRYRVWEANRKIFLFPENWLEPEFRDDKTHLFTELEGALFQGDVSSDLVEDAFLAYLKKLDELARLDIVAMHVEDNADSALRVLHVFGRTYGEPHKYFYRRYAHRMWTAWEPVSAEIEGDHLAPVIWRDRLYLFWVTFLDKPTTTAPAASTTSSKKLGEVSLDQVTNDLRAAVSDKQVELQLHWSEYLQGSWSTRESGGYSPLISRKVPAAFDRSSVFVHVSKEHDTDGSELGVFVHLGGAVNASFHLAGRNSAPESAAYVAKPANPFDSANGIVATRYGGSGALRVSFRERITTEPGKTPPPATPSILQKGAGYTLLPCNTDLVLGVSEEAYGNASNPSAVQAALRQSVGEIASLIKPLFYQDNRNTLFIEPDVTERTIEEWQDWVTSTPQPEIGWQLDDWWRDLEVIPVTPWTWPGLDPGKLFDPLQPHDWLVNPGSLIKFGTSLLGPLGQPGLDVVTDLDVAKGQVPVNINPGSDLIGGSHVVIRDLSAFARSGLAAVGGGLNVVGGGGFNAALNKNLSELSLFGFGAGAQGL